MIFILILLLNTSSTANTENAHSFLWGKWSGKEAVYVAIPELGLDKWIKVNFYVHFGDEGTFELTTGNFLYNLFLNDYKKNNGMNFDSYELQTTNNDDTYLLKLYNRGTDHECIHKIEKVQANQIIFNLMLENDEIKQIVLTRNLQ